MKHQSSNIYIFRYFNHKIDYIYFFLLDLFNRFLGTLKRYVCNKARPEGSISGAYIVNECLTFCSMHLTGIETKFDKKKINIDKSHGEQEDGLSVFS